MVTGERLTVTLTGGAPWGFRLQGGGTFPLEVAKVGKTIMLPHFLISTHFLTFCTKCIHVSNLSFATCSFANLCYYIALTMSKRSLNQAVYATLDVSIFLTMRHVDLMIYR